MDRSIEEMIINKLPFTQLSFQSPIYLHGKSLKLLISKQTQSHTKDLTFVRGKLLDYDGACSVYHVYHSSVRNR